MKIDKFTWVVIGVVLALLVGAIVTLSLAGGREPDTSTYLDEDSPAAAVHNAYMAFLQNDPTRARTYYSADVLADADEDDSFENRFSTYYGSTRNQRLRILDVEMREDGSALATVAIDRYTSGGLFDSGSTWTQRQTVPLVREDGQWKIDTLLLFY